MHAPNPSLAAATTVLRTLAGLGLTHLVTSPGSRNTPLLYAATEVGLTTWSVLDERSAGFAALGAARTLDRPVAVACTSGTAAAHYLPAVAEAANARVPIVVLTADRPAELRDVGAPQAIDQVGLYGTAVRWSKSVGTPEPDVRWMNLLAGIAARAWAEAVDGHGPVHLNLPFREPLGPTEVTGGSPTATLHPEPAPPARTEVDARAVVELLGTRPLVVAGDGAGGRALTELATTVPVLADPLVAARREPLLLRGNAAARAGVLERLTPSGVLRLGGSPTSKAIVAWLADHPEVPQVLVDEVGRRDPAGSARVHLRAEPEAMATALDDLGGDPGWLEGWRAVEHALDDAFDHLPFPSEPAVARIVTECLGDRDLWVGSSMPIRDVDDFGAGVAGRTHGTRGANGIDGLVSAAAGAAAASGRPTVALLGDIAAIHDLGGFVTAGRLGVDLTVVVVDNRGGGIFSFLPQADLPGPFDLLATPHDVDLVAAVGGLGAEASAIETRDDLVAFLQGGSGVRVAVVRTERGENRSLHEHLLDLARAAAAGV